ncbi:lysophospholipase-like protein 1 [Anoplophora glabripennis]|uniref:lysophospholipase-like protein 1 n=1 Tax=Anoplophora glabripennis TaxID=217634 RepID=UPI0008757182|nr:lysophospholipase-like protein 1 [Anoplophora glabripennis]
MSLGTLRIVKQSNKVSSASVIFLHGSGDTGQGILNWIKFLTGDFSLPHINFYFPTAPLRPYTPLQGELSNVWFDRYDITPDVPEHKETLESIGGEIKMFINKVVESGVPLNRIIIGGFSMGGALALHTAYRFNPGLAGVFTLSSFLNNKSAVFNEPKALETPLYMCHGDRDTLVPISWGQKTHKDLTNIGINGEFIPLQNTMHELKKNEMEGLLQWIQKILPPLESDK